MNRLALIYCTIAWLLCVSVANAQKIKFGRDFINKRHSKKELTMLISKDSSIEAAFGKLKPLFIAERGEKFILIGKNCLEGTYRTFYFNVFPAPLKNHVQKAMLVTRTDETLEEWLTRNTGTILLFDAYIFDLSRISDNYEISNVYYQYADGKVENKVKLKFDPIRKTLLIGSDIYRPATNPEKIQDPKITIEYRHNNRVSIINNFRIIFPTSVQKKLIHEILQDCFATSANNADSDSLCIQGLVTDLKQTGVIVFTDNIYNWLKVKQ